jgi:hypothetical protein
MKSAPVDSSPEAVAVERVRLHITPFNEALLKTYIQPAVLPSAANISYHTLDTFPEKAYGYVELPIMEAEKLKKKFNGTILKGTKVRVEDARLEKRKSAPEDQTGAEDVEGVKKRAKKTRKEKGEIAGVVLPEGRSVKRGWTETPSEKRKDRDKGGKRYDQAREEDGTRKREPSKYTNEAECLFRTEVPPNVATQADERKTKKKPKKNKLGESGVVVHEFEQTQKHASFLKSGKVDKTTKMAHEYVDGKGWVDDDGGVIEAETDAQREKRERKERKRTKNAKRLEVEAEEDEEEPGTAAAELVDEPLVKKRKLSNSKLGSGKDSKLVSPTIDDPEGEEVPRFSRSEITISDSPSLPKAVHPLEALFKHPKPTSAEPSFAKPAAIKTSFSFFDNAPSDNEDSGPVSPSNVDDTIMTMENMPQTPFTKQDMEWRRQRSPAPTPDTAAINRKFPFSLTKSGEYEDSAEDEDEEEEEDEEGDEEDGNDANSGATNGLGITNDGVEDGKAKAVEGEKEESEFSKWFWENRGETNRAWKRRRREAMKVKRKRENRRLNRRVV